ncbi:SbmA/BacA-like family transporter [Azorhizobium sp. AG788]|uniref:SbmA/BacA-like family transporter n=1 Tax=Azorhizobium sp. AG788 TaxID=2183897 RepID=UPI00313A0692
MGEDVPALKRRRVENATTETIRVAVLLETLAPTILNVPTERRLILRFWKSAGGFWRGETARQAWLLVALLIATMLLQLLVQYHLNFWNRDFFNAIGRRDQAELWGQALLFVPLISASLVLAVTSVWGRMTIQRQWRAWLSNHLYDHWLGEDRYRRLRFVPGDHQAPEYRIAEDVRVATDLPIDLLLGLLSSMLIAMTFISILWSIGGSIDMHVLGVAVAIPGYLVMSVIAYSVVITAATMGISRHLTRVIEVNKRAEAELRTVGARLRQDGECEGGPSIIGAPRVLIALALKDVIVRWRDLCWQLMRMTLVSHSNLLLTPFIALLLCTPKYVAGSMSLGELIQAAAAFVVVQGAFNWMTDSYSRIAEWVSSANRVASLLLALDQVSAEAYGDHAPFCTCSGVPICAP